MISTQFQSTGLDRAQGDRAALRSAAVALEAQFLSEMLKSAHFGEAREGFGGGAGEAQFASLLRDAQAERLAESGGIGLAEQIFRVLETTRHD